MVLSAENLQVVKDGTTLLDQATFSLAPGEVVGLIGPNGAGKSTLMRAALGLIPAVGTSSLWQMSKAEQARAVAWLPQERHIAWNLKVEAVVGFGRIPHGAGIGAMDREAIRSAMAAVEVLDFADREVFSLSGGEKARVLLARALAQDAPVLMADEPIAALDPAHQIGTMEIFRELAKGGKAVLTSMHDLSLAAQWCDRILVMRKARIVADGPPKAILTDELLEETFEVRFHRMELDGRLILTTLSGL